MDIVEFCEKVLDRPLYEYQKEFIRAVYEATKDGKQIMYIPPRGNDNFTLQLLWVLVIIDVAKERGYLKREIDEKTWMICRYQQQPIIPPTKNDICPVCDGSGLDNRGYYCPKCMGTGRLVRKWEGEDNEQ